MILKFTVIGLCILLIVVIAVSYYFNKEGFDNITAATPAVPTPAVPTPAASPAAATLHNGDTVTCTRGGITGKKYRYENNKLRLYPTNEIAESWHANTASVIIPDCSTMTFGSDITRNSAASSAGTASGAATPHRTEVRPQVTLSDTGYTAMELKQKSDFLKDIQKIVKNELLADRATQHVTGMGQNEMGHTASTMQGQEYWRHSQKSDDQMEHNCPDMSGYIKKDSIPCWGCSLDY
jgi:hypothetical protein